MSNKKDNSPVKLSKSQANELAVVIARMQRNADQVEKDILKSEQLMSEDTEREIKNQSLIHQKVNSECLAEAEGLLKDLFMDVDKSKKLNHPQATEIEKDVKNLHDRWVRDCATYRRLYERKPSLEPTPRINWGPFLDDQQRQLNEEPYGPKLSDVEKQIAEHNILHESIEAYSSQLQPSTTSKDQYPALKEKYANLYESSQERKNNLASLYEYMQSCNKELVYLSGQQERILQRDWSDRMVNPPGVRTEYEKFKTNGLIAHESEINKLQEEGDALIKKKHPGTRTIKAHAETVQGEWQAFLNLCLAQETHLDNIEDYKKFQLEAETLSDSLKRLNTTLDPKSLANKSNPEALLMIEGDEPAVKRNEERLAALKKLSSTVPPLKLRRVQPSKPTSVVSLCDWADEEDTVRRGDKLTLKSNSDNKNWVLQNDRGKTKTLPGACFMVPPPDPEAVEALKSFEKALTDLKSRRSALLTSLKNPNVEAVRPQKAATVAVPKDDPRAAELASELDRINKALERAELEILDRLRSPLDNRNPTQDLANRLQEHEKSVQAMRKLEAEKSAVQREMEPVLAKKPLGPTASYLPIKLRATTNKIDDINTLLDLYNKKATASLYLEKQMKNVDDMVSGYEDQLANDGAILNQPNALQSRNQQLQNLRKDLTSKKDELNKLGKDLDLTQQACSSLQQSFKEYCPDMQRQENEVKQLKNRYMNVSNQLQDRSALLKEAANKNQDFQNAAQSLDFFLVNLPDNKIKPTDDVAQITAKENSQKKVMEDIKRKSADLNQVNLLSRDLQNVLNEYEMKSNIYRSALHDDDDDDDDDDDESGPKKRPTSTMAQTVQRKERDLRNLYAEVSAENSQLLNQLGTTKYIKSRNDEMASQVVIKQQLQLQNQQKDQVESESLKTELNEEIARRMHAEKDLETYRQRLVSLKSRRGVERLEEKEVVQYYRDPKLELELKSYKKRIDEESFKRSKIQSEIEIINERIIKLELQLSRIEPKLVNKVVTEYERDPQLDIEAEKMREEIRRLKLELQSRQSESVHVKSELTVLSQQKPKIKEKVVKKEVVRLEKDPEMLKAVLTFKSELANGESQVKLLNDSVFKTRSQINTLERLIPTIQPKVVSKVVKQVQQDPDTIEESNKLRIALEEERDEISTMTKDLNSLQLRYTELEMLKPKVEVKEIINEIYRVDPETELQLVRLKKDMQDTSRNRVELEKEITSVMSTLTTLRAQKPKVEFKEVTQEVIKEEKSPEIIRELQRLNNQVSRLQLNYDTTLELLTHLRKERDDLKAEKSRVETKLVNKELIKYEDDPLLEKEADRLRRMLREEIHQRRSVEEILFDLQNQYILLERQKPEEKIVTKEVVKLQKDPKQILEHDKLNKTLDDEMKSRRKLELEVRQLRALVQDKQNTLSQMDDRQKKIKIEAELRQVKACIFELENSPKSVEEKIVIEEVLKVERDPELEKHADSLRADMETEGTNINRLEREIRNLRHTLEILQKEKSLEKVVYREVVRVEKDPGVEAERDHLRDLVTQERNLRRDLEDNLQNITFKFNHLQTSKSMTSQEETLLTNNKDALKREREDLMKELRMLETQRQSISITFQQQSKLMSERNQMARQRGLKATSEIQRLEQEILHEKDIIHQREALIIELQNSIIKEDQTETHTRETNLSTKITIMDPETGRPMSPYDAYMAGLIDRNQYIHLSELECDWEEITSTGPDGDVTILQDRKSGRQYPVKDALRAGRLTQYDVMRYKEGHISISEFALMVVGETKKPYIPPPPMTPRSPTKTFPSSPLNSMPSTMRSSLTSLNSHLSGSTNNLSSHLSGSAGNLSSHLSGSANNLSSHLSGSAHNLSSHLSGSANSLVAAPGDEYFPISGIYDTTTDSRMSVRSALTRQLIDTDTALKLLAAQAASGGIVDLSRKDKFSVHKAARDGLIDSGHMYKLLNAQKAFTGVEDPVTKERLPVGPAAKKGYIPEENARRYMEAQYLTGGLVDPSKAGRLTIQEALDTNLIDQKTADELQDEASYPKELVDPITKEKISYKQAMDLCKRDPATGLLLLPAASTDSYNAPSYSSYRFNSPYHRI
ncbi:envoplakin [Xyrichtys novacula]|uniref:Envoplakin n=1 Tax=Xyrichtys novacula TaxID=13765 RepID=A0AAV1GRA0_XYRNO|nr:envoplakin [Xyrichtys novacula]